MQIDFHIHVHLDPAQAIVLDRIAKALETVADAVDLSQEAADLTTRLNAAADGLAAVVVANPDPNPND